MSEKVQPDEVFAFIVEALKSGTSLRVIEAEVAAAARFCEEIVKRTYGGVN